MQSALTLIGFVLLYFAIMQRIERRDDYEDDLERASFDRRTAIFWGEDTEGVDEHIGEIKNERYGDWKNRLRFGAVFWLLAIIGAVLVLVGWLSRPESDQPDMWPIFIGAGGMAGFVYYKLERRILRLEAEIRWLTHILHGVRNLEHNNREKLEPLEGEGQQTLGEILDQALDRSRSREK